MAAGMADVTPNVKALFFVANPTAKSAYLRIIGSPEDDRTVSRMNQRNVLAPFSTSTAGVWETSFTLQGDEQTLDRMVFVMGLLGFGIYI